MKEDDGEEHKKSITPSLPDAIIESTSLSETL